MPNRGKREGRHELFMLSSRREVYTLLLAPADGVVSAGGCWAGTGAITPQKTAATATG